ncbi:unnamed protein product [Agarophyton chilense]
MKEPSLQLPHSRRQRHQRRRNSKERLPPDSHVRFTLEWGSDSDSADSEPFTNESSITNQISSSVVSSSMLNVEKDLVDPGKSLKAGGPSQSAPAILPTQTPHPESSIIPRRYQLEILRRAKETNVIAVLETGAGKTLVAALLTKETLESFHNPTMTARSFSPSSLLPHEHPSSQSTLGAVEPNVDASYGAIQSIQNPGVHSLCSELEAQLPQTISDKTGTLNESPETPTKELDTLDERSGQMEVSQSNSASPKDKKPISDANHTGSVPPSTNLAVDEAAVISDDLNATNIDSSTQKRMNSIPSLFNINRNPVPLKQVVFVVHRVALVPQQASVLQSVLPPGHRVGVFYGDRSGDDWSSSEWIHKLRSKTVLVMTAQILLNLLRHGIVNIQDLALLILDEVHHATGNHPYSRIFVEFYHTIPQDCPRPRVFGMTATPIKRKAQTSSELRCLNGICALEATLDAEIVTLPDDHSEEFDKHVPKPEELVLEYKGNQGVGGNEKSNDDDLESSESRVLSILESDSNSEKNEDRQENDSNMDEEYQNPCGLGNDDSSFQADEIKVIDHICRKLGFIAAHEFALRLCQASGREQREVGTDLLSELCAKQIKTAGIPEKVSKLLDLLCSEWLRCEEETKSSPCATDEFRCIVFIHERSCSLALTWLINAAFQHLNKKALRARSVVGCQNNDSLIRMSRSQLIRTLSDFRKGVFGILVATDVVEEGLDVPACRLVVSFDMLQSPTAYMQARGRARRKNARYVVFLEEKKRSCIEAFLSARRGALVMNHVAKGNHLSEDEKKLLRANYLAGNVVKGEMLCSRTTNAKVGPSEAVSLLETYCNMKASQWGVDNPKPEYAITGKPGVFFATVRINAKSGIDGGCCNIPQTSETFARRYAALDAYKKLYQIGEVDSYLLPRRPSRSQRVLRTAGLKSETNMRIQPVKSRRRSREVQSKASKKKKRVRSCNVHHPGVLQLETSETTQRNQADNDNEQKYSASSVATVPVQKSTISPYVGPPAIPKKLYMYIVKLDCDMSNMAWYEPHKREQFGLLVREQLLAEDLTAVRCPTGKSLFSLEYQKDIEWSPDFHMKAQKYVLFLQLCLWGRTPGSLRALEIAAEEKARGSIAGFLLVPLTKPSSMDYDIDWGSIERAICLKWKEKRNDEDDSMNQKSFEHSLVCSSHEDLDRVYISGQIDEKVTADSSVEGYLNAELFKTFVDYYRDRHKLILKNCVQPMVPAASVRSTMNQLSISLFMLPVETCYLIPISPQACFITGMLPAWQTFLAIRNCWRRNSVKDCPVGFLDFAKALQPNISYVTRGVADLSYERLEFLGDAVLKVLFSMVTFVRNPEDGEGILSDIRDIEVSNQRLADLAIQMKLHNCVAFSGVSQNVKSWPWFWASQTGDQIRISEKVLADCVEALLGVQYVYGGIELVTSFVDKHNLMPGARRTLGFTTGSQITALALPVPPMGSGDNRHETGTIKEVEDILGYTFQDKRHLVIALTHGSFENGYITSYQRYEYLGDALIGFLLLSHFFNEYPDFSPGELTSLRGPALSNDLFARVIVSTGIHRRFWYDCAPLGREIEKFANLVANEEDDDEDVCKTMTVPKVLGDLLESIIGAVVVDKGMRLDGVQGIVLRLMEEELNRFANPSRFRRNPISELVSVVQKKFRTKGPNYEYLDDVNDEQKICVVSVEDQELGKGVGPTRRIARRRASMAALSELTESSDEGTHVDIHVVNSASIEDKAI